MLWDCDGSAGEVWATSDAALVNPQSGRCLDGTGGNTGAGTPLQIWDGNRGAAQQWTLPTVPDRTVSFEPARTWGVRAYLVVRGGDPVALATESPVQIDPRVRRPLLGPTVRVDTEHGCPVATGGALLDLQRGLTRGTVHPIDDHPARKGVKERRVRRVY
jgi:Ricin-type beta-trefoil lectin domain-like